MYGLGLSCVMLSCLGLFGSRAVLYGDVLCGAVLCGSVMCWAVLCGLGLSCLACPRWVCPVWACPVWAYLVRLLIIMHHSLGGSRAENCPPPALEDKSTIYCTSTSFTTVLSPFLTLKDDPHERVLIVLTWEYSIMKGGTVQ